MQLSFRELMTCLHGILFGGFFVMTIFGAIVLLIEWQHRDPVPAPTTSLRQAVYLIATAVLGWVAVLSGAYIVYPWYRAIPPAHSDLALYPQRLLISSPSTVGWHYIGMEWKEHVAWFAPMVITMIAFVLIRHRAAWLSDRQIRRTVLGFSAAALIAALLAGGWGAMIDKAAPVRSSDVIYIERVAK
jgi:hypothetical protein